MKKSKKNQKQQDSPVPQKKTTPAEGVAAAAREPSEKKLTARVAVAAIVVFVFAFLFYSQKIQLVTADLGRHIINGQIYSESGSPISTNHYSYTEPDFPTVNHHWASGWVFYLVWRDHGFDGLSMFYAWLSAGTVVLFFLTAVIRAQISLSLLLSLLTIPLIATREEIRPEGFSYFFLGLYVYLLSLWRLKKIQTKHLWCLPLLQVFWVNLHIFFIMGGFLAVVFWIEAWKNGRDSRDRKTLGQIIVATGLACFLNPTGWRGALSPLTIFKEYGYMLAENQSLLFMHKRYLSQNRPAPSEYLHTEVLIGLALVAILYLCIRRKIFEQLADLLMLLFFGLLAWNAIRAMPLMGYFFIVVFPAWIHLYLIKKERARMVLSRLYLMGCLLLLISCYGKHYFSPQSWRFGWGLLEKNLQAAQVLEKMNLEGAMFNNYDIGGYLIFNLYPKQKVFVDNRPEAYPVSFFKDIYVPMQEDEEKWKEQFKIHDFTHIVFYRRDMTPWAQPFLIRRIQDPAWAAVYVDNYVLILLRRDVLVKRGWQKHEIAKENFIAR